MKAGDVTISDMMFLRIKNLWTYYKGESLAFQCICLYLFVEFFRPQSIFPVLNFAPWAQILLIVSFLTSFFDNKAGFKMSGMHVLVILFALSIHLSFLVAYDVSWSQEYYIFFIQWLVVMFITTTIVTTKERIYVFFLVLFLCSLKIAAGTSRIWAMRGFGFTDWGLKGPPGYFQNSGELAVLMLLLFPIGYYLYSRYKNDVRWWEKYILLAAAVCPVLTILGSSSRGSQVALMVQICFMFWKKIFRPKVLITFAVVAWIGWSVLPEEQKERFTSAGEDKSSVQRLLYWENAWEMMLEHPALGVGYYNFIPYYTRHYPEDILYGQRAQLPHNIFFQIGTDAGFIGLFFYLLIIISSLTRNLPIKAGNYHPDDEFFLLLWKALKLSVLGFVIAGQFVTIGYYPFLWILITFQSCIMIAYNQHNKSRNNVHGRTSPKVE
ncbi:O-antigen ligase family protein [Alteromonas sp. ASW11-130]|uniref:O-antigen ligase family protein n=1 Tax=Alteromonas sp. ASW11-130 TaxID=3015775 RepID=UPI002242AD47|nr:O-antigen ligase family protein [Alteromonas sp. ASW11-130]MCW8091291.1 O-antigen ligase family protein [Alteromonas sp. ASW11-130]